LESKKTGSNNPKKIVAFEIPAKEGTRPFTEESEVHIEDGHVFDFPIVILAELPNDPKLDPVKFTNMDPVKGPFFDDICAILE